MPLVAYKNLPTFSRLQAEGRTVLDTKRAQHQDIREMHIGLLNMMPDAALEATERQFFRLIGESNQIAQIFVHPFTLPEIKRSADTQSYIKKYYESFEDIKKQGLDALVITGANISQPDLEKEPFWQPLQNVMDWAWDNVSSTLCSCLATHAVMQFKYGQKRSPLPGGKLWGVYRHRVCARTHPLVKHMNTVFDAPHSRHNTISRAQFEDSGLHILAASQQAGVHIAVSPDGFRLICFQGHPEYDTVSLMKEYWRDLALYEEGKLEQPPPYPEHYLSEEALAVLEGHTGAPDEDLKKRVGDMLENTWRDSARSIMASWIGLVYQTTNMDRTQQFMDGIDPNDPLGLGKE